MRIAKTSIPTKVNAPGAIARMQLDFGDPKGYGTFAAEYFTLDAGTDLTPLLKGLEGDLCQSPHWGYLPKGEVTVSFKDGSQETVIEGDLFYWPPGHTLKVDKDAELILFSPQVEHCKVVNHIKQAVGQ